MNVGQEVEMTETKLCKDCEYFAVSEIGYIGALPKNGPYYCLRKGETSLVTGEYNKELLSATKERQGECGAEAKFFKQKQSKKSFWERLLRIE